MFLLQPPLDRIPSNLEVIRPSRVQPFLARFKQLADVQVEVGEGRGHVGEEGLEVGPGGEGEGGGGELVEVEVEVLEGGEGVTFGEEPACGTRRVSIGGSVAIERSRSVY
jgi:hypothetical protein